MGSSTSACVEMGSVLSMALVPLDELYTTSRSALRFSQVLSWKAISAWGTMCVALKQHVLILLASTGCCGERRGGFRYV